MSDPLGVHHFLCFTVLLTKRGQWLYVLRSHKEKRSSYAPEKGVRYDGVYRIEKCWRKKGIQVRFLEQISLFSFLPLLFTASVLLKFVSNMATDWNVIDNDLAAGSQGLPLSFR